MNEITKRKMWNGVELDWVRKNWQKYTYKEMGEKLGRSSRHIEKLCRNMGFFKFYKSLFKICANTDYINNNLDKFLRKYHSYCIIDKNTSNLYKIGIFAGKNIVEQINGEIYEFIKTAKIKRGPIIGRPKKGEVYYLKKPVPLVLLSRSGFSKLSNIVKWVAVNKISFNFSCKLTLDDRQKIKELLNEGRSYKELSLLYNICERTIQRIKKSK